MLSRAREREGLGAQRPSWPLARSFACLPALAQAKPLRGFDEEVRDFVTEQYRVHGLHLHPSTSPTAITKGPDGKLTLTAESKDQGKVPYISLHYKP